MLFCNTVIYRFEHHELDTAAFELRTGGVAVPIEPQVFALLALLVAHRDRLVTREEIIAQVWEGRAVSDAAVASRIKSARQALGDSGREQRIIRTVHGVGFRFVGEVTATEPAVIASAPAADSAESASAGPGADTDRLRPSIAVLPFRLVGSSDPELAIADALPQDLITELSRLHWLFVIARGSSFRFRGPDVDIDRVRAALHVRYCLSGSVELRDRTMIVSVELCDTDDRGIVWSDRFRGALGAVHEIREEIVRAVINALEIRIPLHEVQRARLKSPDHLDAWSAYHLGLHHMFRFRKEDNQVATAFFERAVALEPGFARAYAGLSFTHFQDAFLRYTPDVAAAAQLAHRFAERCLELDPVDPFGNCTMGRAVLLRGDLDGCLPWLERANLLSPNYAQATYSRAWTQSLLGRPRESQANVAAALALSPMDPLVYAMWAVRAFCHMGLGELAEAAAAAERAATSPGAHALIELIAVAGHGMNHDDAQAMTRVRSARARVPDLTRAEFFRAFPFRDPATRARIDETLGRFGF
jgi:TolB-like protein